MSGRRPARVAALLLAAFAFTSLPGTPVQPLARALADQRSEALPALFEALLEARSAADAARLEGLIWREWLEPPDAASRELLADLDAAMGDRDLDRALALADELVESAPGFAEAWNKRATIRYLRGEDDASVSDIRETLRLEPRHFGAISGLGLIFLRQGDAEAALGAFEQVLTISPASGNARRSVEQVRRGLGREI